MTFAALLGVAVFLAIALGLFAPLEAWAPAVPAPKARWPAVLACIGLFTLNTALMSSAGGALLDAVGGLVAPRPPTVWRVALALVLGDVCGYWVHRAMHEVPVLWRLHRVHHAPTHLTWLEAWRQHPLDFVAHGLAVGLPAALLGASLGEVSSVVLVRKLYTSFLHANVSDRSGRLGLVVATPAFHRAHHGALPAQWNTNFAGTFPWVDWLFGTYRAPPGEPGPVGLGDASKTGSAAQEAASPPSLLPPEAGASPPPL